MGLYELEGQHIDVLISLVEDKIEDLKADAKVWGDNNSDWIKECRTILRRLKKPVKIEK